MTRFQKIVAEAKKRGVIVEKVGGSDPYEVYREDDHSMVGICKNLWEVESEVESFARQRQEALDKIASTNYVI